MILQCSAVIHHQLSVSHFQVFSLTHSASKLLHFTSLTPVLVLCNFTFLVKRLLALFPTRNRIDHPLSAVRITFYSERLLASLPTRNRIDHPLSAVHVTFCSERLLASFPTRNRIHHPLSDVRITFYSERLLASFLTRNRIDHPLSAVRIPKTVFPFENQRTHCAIVIETPHGRICCVGNTKFVI
jgi:hypothetical protein